MVSVIGPVQCIICNLFARQWRNKRTDRTVELNRTAMYVARHWRIPEKN